MCQHKNLHGPSKYKNDKLKNSSEINKTNALCHYVIIKNKMKEGNRSIKILSYIMKENRNIVGR
jgi:hypothetical protein